MSFFDITVLSVFNYYKKRFKPKANRIAIYYISFLQSSIILVLGVFFSVFFKQMNVSSMSAENAWILFSISVVAIYFKNWIQYSGKKRKILNAKSSSKSSTSYNIFALWLLPVANVVLSIILLKAF